MRMFPLRVVLGVELLLRKVDHGAVGIFATDVKWFRGCGNELCLCIGAVVSCLESVEMGVEDTACVGAEVVPCGTGLM